MWRRRWWCAQPVPDFYSHIPCGMWPQPDYLDQLNRLISTHTSRVGCDTSFSCSCFHLKISTHTSRVGCDYPDALQRVRFKNFYSHIPCGMWPKSPPDNSCNFLFLLTHPVWDVTQLFYPFKRPFVISTHTSRVGCDHLPVHNIFSLFYFYSHIPCGMWLRHKGFNHICLNFYSHIPCGMWRCTNSAVYLICEFLLTHPVWDVTNGILLKNSLCSYFYSHIPCGMWPSGFYFREV